MLNELAESKDSATKLWVSLVYMNLSSHPEVQESLVGDGMLKAMKTLSMYSNVELQASLATSLCNLSSLEKCRRAMIEQEMLPGAIVLIVPFSSLVTSSLILCTSSLFLYTNLTGDLSSPITMFSHTYCPFSSLITSDNFFFPLIQPHWRPTLSCHQVQSLSFSSLLL